MAVELANDKTHLVVKRDGRTEQYNQIKLRNVLLWAADGNTVIADSILQALEIRIYNRIDIRTLFDEVIDTTFNMISRLTPVYERVTLKLYLQKMYKDTWGSRRGNYPTLAQYFDEFGGKEIIDIGEYNFTDKDLAEFDMAVVPDRDFTSSHVGMQIFFEKYSLRGKELLQHGFMRMAIQAYLYDTSKQRNKKIIARYNNLSLGRYTEATPKFKNSLREKFAGASCCVHKMDDTSESINQTCSDIGQYSRADGGNACDVSSLRASGSSIGTVGRSSGPIPFIKKVEASVNAYNQNGSRPGVCAVYYPWWHADVMSMLPLMDEGGKENQRARNLKFSIKLNRLFLRAIEKNEDIYLFDPKVVPHFNELYGEAFDAAYNKAVEDGLYSQVIPARTLALSIAKERSETGNLYVFFVENVNEQSPFKDVIYSSNLCMEVLLPTAASKYTKSVTFEDITTRDYTTVTEEKTGLTALCNLSSINVDAWMELSLSEKRNVAKELLESSDNLIDYQVYPTKNGEIFNRKFRAIGIGMNNLAFYYAKRRIKFSDEAAKGHMEKISKSIHDVFNEASYNLAMERGSFDWIDRTTLTEPSRFATLFAIAPTATSSLIINATEGIEPVAKLLAEKTGTYSTKQLAPELTKYGMNYELAATIPTQALYDLAAIRQKYLDQGQSLNTYAKDPKSAYEIFNDIIYAESIGLLTLYYLQSTTALDQCESCGS